jgi:FkbH-like protein
MDVLEIRKETDRLVDAGGVAASAALRELWLSDQSPSTAAYVVSRFERLRPGLSLLPYRVAILRSFTVEPIVPMLRACAFSAGIDLTVQTGHFNAYAQEILDETSALYRFAPDAVVLAAAITDAAQVRDLVPVFRSRSQAHLILHGAESPIFPAAGLLDTQSEAGEMDRVQEINREIRSLARSVRGVYFLDYDSLIARHGRLHWRDDRKWQTVRLPVRAEHLIHVAREWMRFLHPLTGRIAKALAVDLDNTLWGGIIGEEGLDGIRLGDEYPGAAYRELQNVLLDLYRRGVLLAICSKNNMEDAMEALTRHPGMVLRPEHFAAVRINWNDKAQNLKEIAEELNIGIDAIAFLDDNPVERKRIRDALPEVHVIEMPANPSDYARTLREVPLFERLALSEEDRRRGELYAAERRRAEAERTATTKEDFFRALQQEAEILPVGPATLPRVAQLTQKTNQFNLTTRRYTEQQIAAFAADARWRVCSMRVTDRYSDNGLVGVAITHDRDDACEIDTFLLSCRVIGRTVETALLAHLADAARDRGVRRLEGRFVPTRKNSPAADFYRDHGFELVRQDGPGSVWALDLSLRTIACPEWIRVTHGDGGKGR